MNLSLSDDQVLTETHSWSAWIGKNMPSAMLNNMDPRLKGLLVDTLRHFHYSGGAGVSVYGEGALLVVESDAQLVEEMERLVSYNICRMIMKSCHGDTPQGQQNLTITQLDFSTSTCVPDTGLNDEAKLQAVLDLCAKSSRDIAKEEVLETLSQLDREFLISATTEHVAENVILNWRCHQDVNVKAEVQEHGQDHDLICFALANRRTSPTGFIANLLKVIRFHGFSLEAIQTIYVPQMDLDEYMITHFYLAPPKGEKLERLNTMTNRLLEAMAVAQWFEFDNELNREYVYELGFSLHHTILMRAIEEFTYQMLVHVDANLYNPSSIHEAFVRHPDIGRELVKYFSCRFNPVQALSEEKAQEKKLNLLAMIERLDSGIPINDDRRKTIYNLGVAFVAHVLKSNYYVLRRSALSFRVDPQVMLSVPFVDRESLFPEIPYGIFFIKGKNFFAFNIRFRALARGGVRTLLPMGKEKEDYQHRDVFRECYQLAYTQQKKNKDIPEGGSKSVIFVKNYVAFERDILVERNVLSRKFPSKEALGKAIESIRHTKLRRQLFDAQRSFCDTVLDLVLWNDESNALRNEVIKDYYGKEELIFLGPDENMLDQMIDWISTRSLEREYRVGKAFMSGKKDEGINHKAYGVTSLGVHEYLKACLKARGLEGQSFSVKVSGGPDGDVAGNELMNLISDFGNKVKITGVIDGTGFLMDPEGIHQGELKRLFTEGIGVSSFAPEHLGEGAHLLLIHDRREENKGVEEVKCLLAGGKESWLGASEANGIYSKGLLKLKTDVFLPCGGRPRTLNASNWQTFLDDKGNPTSNIIVEGANLFLDEVARKNLEQKGVLIIKDASANKCGVICSSYEIMSGLLLTKEEFLLAKDILVEQVLEKLILKAGWEAKLLVENLSPSDSVIHRSDEVSRAINHWTDAIAADIEQLRTRGDYDAMLDQVIQHVVPKILRDVAGERIKSLPSLYLDALLSATMASALVYRYGVDYQPSLVVSLGSEVEMGLFK